MEIAQQKPPTRTENGFQSLSQHLPRNSEVLNKIKHELEVNRQTDDSDQLQVFDLNDVRSKCRLFEELMPRVKPHFAVKCNDNMTVLKVMVSMGLGFDCASAGEIKKVLDLGADPDKIIFAHTMKRINHLRYAEKMKVRYMTFDSPEELKKIKVHHSSAKLLLRIEVEDSLSTYAFSGKFGARLSEVEELVGICRDLDLELCGVAFHVGGITSPSQFYGAIEEASEAFKIADTAGMPLSILDIGGGFPGVDRGNLTIAKTAAVVNEALDKFFPEHSDVTVVAEPGAFYVASAMVEICQVVGIKPMLRTKENSNVEESVRGYFVNSGILSTFFDTELAELGDLFIFEENFSDEELFPSVIWGQTLVPNDIIRRNVMLPKLQIGDIIGFNNLGHYSRQSATEFCCFGIPKIHFVGEDE